MYTDVLYMDLKPQKIVTGARWRVPLALGILGLVVSAAVYSILPRSETPSRPLGVEERETVISLFTALEHHVPELAHFTEEVREVFTDDTMPAQWVAGSTPLVALKDDALVFSDRFFLADPVAQETALLDAVLTVKHQPARAEGAVVIKPE